MSALRALAPAKVNLGLLIGPVREADGRHELVSVMQSISLSDELTLEDAPEGGGDMVDCPAVEGPPDQNLAARALAGFRAASGWDGPAQRLRIHKRIPVAAGLGGGSADAAAALRLIAARTGSSDQDLLMELAAGLGADVPAQLAPGRWLATGAGELLQALPPPRPFGLLVLPALGGLSTAAVYRRRDELGIERSSEQLADAAARLAAQLGAREPLPRDPDLLANDLQQPAEQMQAEIAPALEQVREAGCEAAFLCGSGPTVAGILLDAVSSGLERARVAAVELAARPAGAFAAEPVGSGFGRPRSL